MYAETCFHEIQCARTNPEQNSCGKQSNGRNETKTARQSSAVPPAVPPLPQRTAVSSRRSAARGPARPGRNAPRRAARPRRPLPFPALPEGSVRKSRRLSTGPGGGGRPAGSPGPPSSRRAPAERRRARRGGESAAAARASRGPAEVAAAAGGEGEARCTAAPRPPLPAGGSATSRAAAGRAATGLRGFGRVGDGDGMGVAGRRAVRGASPRSGPGPAALRARSGAGRLAGSQPASRGASVCVPSGCAEGLGSRRPLGLSRTGEPGCGELPRSLCAACRPVFVCGSSARTAAARQTAAASF